MNEAGKSAVLTALHRLKPISASPFDVQQDYPRWLKTKDARAGLIATTRPIEATFTLDDADLEAVQELFGENVLAGTQVVMYRMYDDPDLHWDLSGDAHRAMTNVVQRLELPAKASASLTGLSDFPALAAAAAKAKAAVPVDDEDASDVSAALDRLAAEVQRVSGGKRLNQALADLLGPRIPTFFYFADYSILNGRIDLQELADGKAEAVGSTSDQTARSLLALAGTTVVALAGENYEDRKAELEAVSNDLTEQVFEYWKQNPHLRVTFDLDRKIAPDPHGNQRVEDTRHRYTNNFSQRSSGFRWFFSFLAAFTEFEQREQNHVVLLDEPGLTLHGRAQADFLHFINDRLGAAAQVLYTTHSPFMVETGRLERIRVVEDGGPELGAQVSQEILGVSDNSLFPLQAALGYDIAQHLFIGDANLLVEGPSDFLYLDTISRHLGENGASSLDPDWRILPAGGLSNIPAFVALLGGNLDVTVLIDSGTENTQRLEAAMKAGRLKRDRLISVSEITGHRHGDLEDLFAIPDYLMLYNRAFGTALKPKGLPPGDRIVKRIEQVTAKYDHYKPAETLLRQRDELMPALSDETLTAFGKLIERINGTR